MRLGAYNCILDKDSVTFEAYKKESIFERHRHRYEFNNSYRKVLEDNGMRIVGLSPDKELVEVVEIDEHPWFVGCQFHPEFKSKPVEPHPLFKAFIKAAIEYK